MELSSKYQPSLSEEKIYTQWEKAKIFEPKGNGKPFSIAIPPPNITGSLHMGHALNNTCQDILVRFARMQGRKVVWIPGTDHAGIATQNVVEKMLRKQDKSRHDLGRDEFIKEVWRWQKEYGSKILDQFKKLGCSLDWSRLAFTMDEHYEKAVLYAFVHYYQKGLIYQGERVINWCTRCASSLSDLEVESEEREAKLYLIRYPLLNKKLKTKNQKYNFKIKNYLTVATTRPETMLGDMAVAVNPKDKRYAKLIGEKVVLPLTAREIPIVADEAVDQEFGTGAVKVTPAHSFIDFEISERQSLERIKIIDEQGKFTDQAPEKYQGMKVSEAREAVVADLRSAGLLEKVEDYNLVLPVCSRCNKVVEPLLSKQWFLKMDELKKPAIQAIKAGKIKFTPSRYEKICLDWLEKSYDWCISRQLWWGHRLPVWYQTGNKSQISNLSRTRDPARAGKSQNDNSKFQITSPKIFVGAKSPKGEGWVQSEDVLDTWFSSALWSFASFGWEGARDKTADLREFHPTSVLSTARDIIFLWVARMIFSSLEFLDEVPFEKVYIHPTVLNEKGQRMSKSLGTGIDPLALIQKYGADAVRFGLMYQNTGVQDLKFSEAAIVASQKFCNKVWNVARFIGINLEETRNPKGTPSGQDTNKFQIPNSKTLKDKKIFEKLAKTKNQVANDLEKFEFGRAAHLLYDFVWHNLADTYLEESKKQMQDKKLKANTQEILLYLLVETLKMLHPFTPFITEEIWGKLYQEKLVIQPMIANCCHFD